MKPATSCRSCGDVSAGVWIFSPPRLLSEEPRGDEGQGLVMMPGFPVPDLVVGQARLSLGAFQTLFDPMFRLRHARQLLQRNVGVGIRQIVIMLERAVALALARDKQQLLGTGTSGRRSGLDATLYGLDHQRALFTVPHLNRGPRIFGQCRSPRIHTLERHLGKASSTRIVRRRDLLNPMNF